MYARVGLKSLLALATAGLVLAGCNKKGPEGDQATGSVSQETARNARESWPEGAAAKLDSANAAFSNKNYQAALGQYQALLAMPNGPKNMQVTAYFGIYMTQMALGDSAAAAAAAAKLQELAPEASLVHGNPMLDSGAAPRTPNDSIHRPRGQ